jgi:hypothetical protein
VRPQPLTQPNSVQLQAALSRKGRGHNDSRTTRGDAVTISDAVELGGLSERLGVIPKVRRWPMSQSLELSTVHRIIAPISRIGASN